MAGFWFLISTAKPLFRGIRLCSMVESRQMRRIEEHLLSGYNALLFPKISRISKILVSFAPHLDIPWPSAREFANFSPVLHGIHAD